MGYQAPTPIQQAAIPVALSGQDLIGIAQTGTGKTAAYGIPMVTALSGNPDIMGLVLAPTRELALQIEGVFAQLTRNFPNLRSCVLIGGASMHLQLQALAKKPRILIATPGRLLDHLQQKSVSLAKVRLAVLDEADRMLDIGFEPQIRRVFFQVPQQRQTMLFSATFPPNVERLAAQHLSRPQRITIGAVTKPLEAIQQSFIKTSSAEKMSVLLKELEARQGTVLIFTRTKHRSDRLARLLSHRGYKADRLHGDLTQGQRQRVMEAFRREKIRILVATDIASRGLDIPHIAHVINYDLPQVPEDYIHRIGRTARAGASGASLCLVTPEDIDEWTSLARRLGPAVAPPPPKGRVRRFRPSFRAR